jgi:hypothetical protein
MKILAKIILQFILVLALSFTLIPSADQIVFAENQNQADLPVSFTVISTGQEDIELALSAPSYQILDIQIEGQTFDQLLVPGTTSSTTPGQPQLPISSKLFAVPPQAKITIEITNDVHHELEGIYRLAPVPLPASLDETSTSKNLWDHSQTGYIKQSDPSQAITEPVRIAEEAWIRDQRVIRLEYSPFLYNTESGSLVWYPSIKVKIHFDFQVGNADSALSIDKSKLKISPYQAILANLLLNYEQAKYWQTDNIPTQTLVTPPSTGERLRIVIDEDGIYKLTYDVLSQVYPELLEFDPRQLHMTNQGEDVAIHIVGENDGSFDPEDYIIFYGQRFHGNHLAELYKNENQNWWVYLRQTADGGYYNWKPELNALMLEKYTKENIYWLYGHSTDGLRMETADGNPGDNSNRPVENYRETVRAEQSWVWKTSSMFNGEESWFWELITTAGSVFEYQVTATSKTNNGPPAIIRAEFVSEVGNFDTIPDHHTKMYLNSNGLGESAGYYWFGKSRFSFEQEVTASTILEGANTFGIQAINDVQYAIPKYYFDWFEIEYNRLFVAQDNAIIFTSPLTGTQKYQVTGFTDTSGLWVLDITDNLKPVRVQIPDDAVNSGQVTISLDHDDLSIAMDGLGKTITSDQVSYYQSPDWSAMGAGADYVFITHKSLLAATQTLANHKMDSGITTLVIDVNDLYNEFNYGIYNPIAIKNFLGYTFEDWVTTPTYALLVGDGHWNFLEHNLDEYGAGPQLMPPHLAWVDPWQGEVDSANLLATIVGDDPIPDVMIARLPVNSEAELNAYIDKLIDYQSAPQSNWEYNHIFATEDPDLSGDFTTFAENIVGQYIDPHAYANPVKVYQEDFGCDSNNSPNCDDARSALINAINDGSLILNYIGHASVQWWSHEQLFTPSYFDDLTNIGKLPVILSLTCLDGYWNLPANKIGPSMIEEIVRLENTGAIAAFSPTGLGVSTGHDYIHQGFYHSLMNDGIWELGSAALNGKLQLYQSGANFDLLNTYTIFGDPSLQIRNPFSTTKIFLPLVSR